MNSQFAISIFKKNGPFMVEIFSKSASLTEKGGVMVHMTAKDGGAKAVAVGVHLDAGDDAARNLQICKIVNEP